MLNPAQLIWTVNCTCDLGILRKRNEVAHLAFSKNSPVGFVERSIRKTAEGCKINNIGCIEGWYIEKDFINRGLGRRPVKIAKIEKYYFL